VAPGRSQRPRTASTNRAAHRMASRSKRVTVADRVEVDATKVLGGYQRWLARQPLAGRTRDAYCAQVHGFVDWLAASEHGGAALVEAHVRD